MDTVWRGLIAGAIVGAVLSAVVAGIVILSGIADPRWLVVVSISAMAGSILGGAWELFILDRRPYRIDEWAPLNPLTVLRHATRTYLAAGWDVTDGSDTRVVFSRRGKPNGGVLIVLLLVGVLPGIIYWFAAGRTLTTSVSAVAVPGGCDVEMRVNQGGDGATATAVGFFNSLHDLVAESPDERRRAA